MSRRPLDLSYMDAAPGRWKWITWAIFALAGAAYLAGAGALGIYLMGRLGPVAGILVFNLLAFAAIPLFKAGMSARRRKAA